MKIVKYIIKSLGFITLLATIVISNNPIVQSQVSILINNIF